MAPLWTCADLGKTPELENPETYDASLLLANQRVRGVGYEPIGRDRIRFKERIPKGWHLNVCDPNLRTNDPKQNTHAPLCRTSRRRDFRDFINQAGEDVED
jgi:hypothetical protein